MNKCNELCLNITHLHDGATDSSSSKVIQVVSYTNFFRLQLRINRLSKNTTHRFRSITLTRYFDNIKISNKSLLTVHYLKAEEEKSIAQPSHTECDHQLTVGSVCTREEPPEAIQQRARGSPFLVRCSQCCVVSRALASHWNLFSIYII